MNATAAPPPSGALRAIWSNAAEHRHFVIDQTRLPFEVCTLELKTLDDAATAIKTMQVRGAPLIGVVAAYGVGLAMDRDPSDAGLARALATLRVTRPTAVNLMWALDRMRVLLAPLPEAARSTTAWPAIYALADQDVATNYAIGQHGLSLLRALHQKLGRQVNILTHCNAGAMACVDYGTALAPIYLAKKEALPVHVYVDETRPRNQGLITALELRQAGIDHTYIVDNAGGHLMQHGKVDVVIVGADRIAANGDAANKIGTYLKALAAHDNSIPFYVAAPLSTVDLTLRNGVSEIEIEERAEDEVRAVIGVSGENGRNATPALILDKNTPVSNPGFDVTPACLVTGIITERGVFAPSELARAFVG